MSFSLHYRLADGVFRGPTPVKAVPKRALKDAVAPAPLLHDHGFTECCEVPVSSGVRHLLTPGSPPNICGFVIPVAVNPVRGMFLGWGRSHVSKEILKGAPAFANNDATSAVVGVIRRGLLLTALNHASPAQVFMRLRPALRLPVFCASRNHRVYAQAPTGFRVSTEQVTGPSFRLFSAIALAKPNNQLSPAFVAVVSNRAFRYEAAKSLSSYIARVFVKLDECHAVTIPRPRENLKADAC